jgi:putative membrane protein
MWGANLSEWGGNYCGWGASFGHGPWFFGWLFPLLFWGLIAYLLLSFARHFFSSKPSEQNDGALDVLRNRFASGEIDEQEYTTRKAILKGR